MSAHDDFATLQRRANELSKHIEELRAEKERLLGVRWRRLGKPRAWLLVRVLALVAVVVLSATVTALGFSPFCRPRTIDESTIIHLARSCERGTLDETCDDHSITLHGDGRVEWRGRKGRAEGRVPRERVQAIADRMLSSCFLRMRSYQHWERPLVLTSITIGDEEHTVEHFATGTCVAPRMREIESDIESVAIEQGWLAAP